MHRTMTKHQKPNPEMLPNTPSNSLPVPEYLNVHYWWAYVHPKAVRFFERQWLVNLILWGNYNRLRSAALADLGSPIQGKTLQIACAYGDITPLMVDRLEPQASLDIIDILPVQLGNLSAKLGPKENVKLHCMDSSALKYPEAEFDQVLLFFLLHEQPRDVREKTLHEAVRVLKPGGKLVIVDYSKPHWANPLRYFWKPVLWVLEPFARDLLNRGIAHWLPNDASLQTESCRDYFGGLYQKFVIRKSA
jgi:ubiquinone/menaquinone biosynthesis C-methylase UbiE